LKTAPEIPAYRLTQCFTHEFIKINLKETGHGGVDCIHLIDSKGFWGWCIALERNTGQWTKSNNSKS